MKHFKWAAIALVAISAPAFASGLAIQPGLWQMTTKMTVTGGPSAFMPHNVKYKICLKKQAIEHPWNSLHGSSGKNGGCTFSNIKAGSHGASWDMKCTGSSTSEGHTTLYVDSPVSMHEIQDMTMKSSDMTMKFHAEGKAHRIGSCPAKK